MLRDKDRIFVRFFYGFICLIAISSSVYAQQETEKIFVKDQLPSKTNFSFKKAFESR